jgi:hypothetical protein
LHCIVCYFLEDDVHLLVDCLQILKYFLFSKKSEHHHHQRGMAAVTIEPHEAPRFILALDVGSGACKAALIRLSSRSSGVNSLSIARIYGREVECLLGHLVAAQANRPDGKRTIPKEAVELLHRAMTAVMTESKHALLQLMAREGRGEVGSDRSAFEATWKGVRRVGIATAIFRETSNGLDVLNGVSRRFRCSLAIASQQLEGMVGYRTGCLALKAFGGPLSEASNGGSAGNFVVWDSGGASFQLTLEKRIGGGAQRQLAAYEGQWGSSKSTRAVVEDIQGRRFPADSANPMTMEHVTKSIEYFIKDFAAKEKQGHEQRVMASTGIGKGTASSLLTEVELRHAVAPRSDGGMGLTLVAIGGPTSAFRVTATLVRLHQQCSSSEGAGMGAAGTTSAPSPGGALFVLPKFEDELPSPVITLSMLLDSLRTHVVGRSDAYLAELGLPQHSMVGPKVCLVVSVMKYFGIPAYQYVPTVGSTLGIAEASHNGTLFAVEPGSSKL